MILTGQYANKSMKKRVLSLKQLIVFVENVNSQISFSKKTIQEIIRELSCSGEMKLKTITELAKKKDGDFSENWRNSVRDFSTDDCLNNEDVKILTSFGNSLGVTDLDGQINNCRLHINMLEKQLKDAEEKLKEKSKVNTAMSMFLAMASVIIFY